MIHAYIRLLGVLWLLGGLVLVPVKGMVGCWLFRVVLCSRLRICPLRSNIRLGFLLGYSRFPGLCSACTRRVWARPRLLGNSRLCRGTVGLRFINKVRLGGLGLRCLGLRLSRGCNLLCRRGLRVGSDFLWGVRLVRLNIRLL